MVKAIKVPLRKVLGDSLLTYVELLTVVKEIEAQVNDRPLVQASETLLRSLRPLCSVLEGESNFGLISSPEPI